ncbi:uncharacterized protein LOC126746103 isoform X2 [Anthonomus grandis grandis]|uniref:uncharacterized protein LOC126746103 isoform X2 n=1 Tax=Anthonomus grandis grandis TaxID=2921223 RepID=UPI002165F584|nr:uncharacterized protein LOC126746103 isoform X2 [Anthonomus grandis grandis]
MYATKKNGLIKCNSVNAARKSSFQRNFAMSHNTELFKSTVTNFEPSMISPCQSELQQHLLRTMYINSMWCRATEYAPTILNPLDYGWILKSEQQYGIEWFKGDQMPDNVIDVLNASVEEETNKDVLLEPSIEKTYETPEHRDAAIAAEIAAEGENIERR